MEIVKLKFTSPLHLSRGKSTLDESFDVLHSDTLKSALFVCALELYGTYAINEQFFEAFTISSAFPFVKDELFFPKPELLPDGLMKRVDRKKAKKIKYFTQAVFNKILRGGDETVVLTESNIHNIAYYTETVLTENQPYISQTVQRVTVNRTFEEEGNTFYTERLYFTEGCGLFFILKINIEKYEPIIKAALRLLGDNGIGSDKSVGNGQFEFETKPFAFEHFNAEKQVTLSLYCPQEKEVKNESFLKQSAYNLIKRGGYIANPNNFDKSTLRKKSIVMFTEGSVFSKEDTKDLIGKVVDLIPKDRPDVGHPIYRDGRALFLPYNLKTTSQDSTNDL
jgi:CRISPR-associated protein Csm4